MLIVKDLQTYDQALEFITQAELLAYDTETTGLNVRMDKVIGFGVSTALDGVYVPIWEWDAAERNMRRIGVSDELVSSILRIITKKRLICWNTAFDAIITKNNLGVDVLQAVYCDAMLLKHTVDESFPFALKEVGAMVFGTDVKTEQQKMLDSVRINGGLPTEFYKADMEKLAEYCVKDCMLTYRLYQHYSKELSL